MFYALSVKKRKGNKNILNVNKNNVEYDNLICLNSY